MPRYLRCASIALIVAAIASCIPDPAADPFEAADLKPPSVSSWGPTSAREIVIYFDEAVNADVGTFATSPGPTVLSTRDGPDGASVVVELEADQEMGASYAVSGFVKDASGNASSFVLPYWGFNPDPPNLVISELLSEGSSTHPDAVEFFVMDGGNLAGIAFYIGSPGDYDIRYVFSSLAVEAGDFVVLHMKPEETSDEIDETTDKTASGGLDASAGAWDLWYSGGDGAITGKNGALALCTSPNGAYLDALLYSARTSDSDTDYGGFGTAALRDRVAEIVAAGAWTIAGDAPAPEDCAATVGITVTRTLCRGSSFTDTNAGSDWHIVPTKGESLGAVNSDEVYSAD